MFLHSPRASPSDQSGIATLVQKCLDAQGQNVAATEAEIGAIAPRFYGLTDAERAIVEGKER